MRSTATGIIRFILLSRALKAGLLRRSTTMALSLSQIIDRRHQSAIAIASRVARILLP
jgi:hypothetical protein